MDDKQKELLKKIEDLEDKLESLKEDFVDCYPYNIGDKVKVFMGSDKKRFSEVVIVGKKYSAFTSEKIIYICKGRKLSFPVYSRDNLELIESSKC